jgi:N-acetylmuramoyl-L-alanine amidase
MRRLLALAIAGLGFFSADALVLAVPPRSPPTRAAPAEQTIKLDGIQYVDTVDFAKRFGLKASWLKKNHRILLENDRCRLELEADSREARLNGLRVFLGDAARLSQHSLFVSRIDALKLLTPLVLPGAGQGQVPPLKVIVIDPGHGGKDPGKENNTLHVNEKTFTLDVALRLRKLLDTQGYRTVMTRIDDRAVELGQRPEIATRASADLFVSIHFNSVEKDVARVTGTETYTMTPQSQRSTVDSTGTVFDSLSDPASMNPGNVNDHWNAVLGYEMHRALLGELKTFDRGMKRGRLAVLRLATCPAVLVESAYLSNNEEARKVATAAFRQKIAESIAKGINSYGTVLAAARAK